MSSLKCPITLEFLEDPVNTPCCGRAISREAFASSLDHNPSCPLCRTDLSDFDVSSVPTCRDIAYLVEEARERLNPVQIPEADIDQWKAEITVLTGNQTSRLNKIGKLQISCDEAVCDNLFVIVVDRSGSMNGEPIKQVSCALNCAANAAYANPHLRTVIVPYCHSAESYPINTSFNRSQYDQKFKSLCADGGTSFEAAFNEIVRLATEHANDDNIGCMTILFLTDGEDSSVRKSDRGKLVDSFRNRLQVWKKDYVVHTIGFGRQHDSDFLDALRKIGSEEGAYRYADPSENSDALFGKIDSIIKVVAGATVTKRIDITSSNLKIKHSSNGTFWAILPNTIDPITFKVDDKEITIIPEMLESDSLWPQWYSILIDEIVEELLMRTKPSDSQEVSLPNNDEALERELHLELLTRRSNAILCRLSSDDHNYERLKSLLSTIEKLKEGLQVDTLKLRDAKFEGQFATGSSGQKQLKAKPEPHPAPVVRKQVVWETVDLPSKRLNFSSEDIVIQLSRGSTSRVCELIESTHLSEYGGSTLLHLAASIGRVEVVRKILEKEVYDVNSKNPDGHTALDLAVLYGWWITYDLLSSFGAKISIGGELLLRTCISRGYTQLAGRLLKDYSIVINDEMLNNAPNASSLQWLSSHCDSSFPIETAILKGALDIVTEKLPNTEIISWAAISRVFTKTGEDYLQIVDLILRSRKASANEICSLGEDEITFPLFIAAEKGNLEMVKVLRRYLSEDDINQRNNKGTTALWIACCNKHIDVVYELIQAKADLNITNKKGDSALIPCCQKGSDSIVSLLLDSGIDLNLHNENRDNAVLICCRTGQAKILEMLLKRYDTSSLVRVLEEYAEIDGNPPLLAAAELDKVECIKVVVKYGADLEWKTREDNPIIQGATALHLACHYGRLNAAQVLCELGADINSRTSFGGHTPLHIAIKSGNISLVGYLLSRDRSSLDIADDFGRTPAYYANMQGREDIKDAFFTDHLSDILGRVVAFGSPKCIDVLNKYSTSYGCYNYDDFIDKKMYKGMSLMSLSLVYGNSGLTNALESLGVQNTTDDYGITSDFWKAYLYKNEPGVRLSASVPPTGLDEGFSLRNNPTDQVREQINRVKAIAGANLQNKMLTDLAEQPVLLSCEKMSIDFRDRMNNGFNNKIHSSAISKIKNSSQPPILGFLEKLKKSNVFPEGKNYLEYLLWEARLHIVKLIASGETTLDPIHMMALYLYTSNATIFSKINSLATDVWNPIVVCMYQAVKSLPSIECEVYRGVDCKFDERQYAIGSKLTWNTFGVTSKSWDSSVELIKEKKGVIFIIQSKNGKDISRYSDSPVNGEVLFLPGTSFVVKALYRADVVALGQANIRGSTFTANENDIRKAVNGEACIIVEIVEA